MSKKAVIIYGPPGSGKGTQAELLAKIHGFIHFDTGRYVESILRAPGWNKNAVLRRERKLFDGGKLMTPSFVLKIVAEATTRIAKADLNIVFSGSPRTMFEAFGKNNNGLIKVLEKHYGKKNIAVIKLNIKDSTTLKRNSARLVCSLCGLPSLPTPTPKGRGSEADVISRLSDRSVGSRSVGESKNCSFCGAALRRRTLDKPEVIKIRLNEYHNRTFPILAQMKKMGILIKEINGELAPFRVFENLQKTLRLK